MLVASVMGRWKRQGGGLRVRQRSGYSRIGVISGVIQKVRGEQNPKGGEGRSCAEAEVLERSSSSQAPMPCCAWWLKDQGAGVAGVRRGRGES